MMVFFGLVTAFFLVAITGAGRVLRGKETGHKAIKCLIVLGIWGAFMHFYGEWKTTGAFFAACVIFAVVAKIKSKPKQLAVR